MRILAARPNFLQIAVVFGTGKDLEDVLGLLARRQGSAAQGKKNLAGERVKRARTAPTFLRGSLRVGHGSYGEKFLAGRRPAHATHQVDRLFAQRLHRRAAGLVVGPANQLCQVGRGVAHEATALLLGILLGVQMHDEAVRLRFVALVLDAHAQVEPVAVRFAPIALLNCDNVRLRAEDDGVRCGLLGCPGRVIGQREIRLGEGRPQGRQLRLSCLHELDAALEIAAVEQELPILQLHLAERAAPARQQVARVGRVQCQLLFGWAHSRLGRCRS